MKYQDKSIVLRKCEKEKRKYCSVETGIYVGEELITFKNETLFDDKIKVMLPENFKEMDSSAARKKYSSEQRTEVIISNKNYTVNFTFNLLEKKIDRLEVEETIDKLADLFKGVFPSDVFGEKGELNYEDRYGRWFCFQSFSLNETVNNFLCVISIKDIAVLGMFNCLLEQGSDWNPVFIKVAETIDFVNKENK